MVYRYESEDTGEETLVFYETKMDEMFRRQVRDLCCMAAYDDHCVVICQIDEVGGAVCTLALSAVVLGGTALPSTLPSSNLSFGLAWHG